jgi:hypothetical protein
VAAAAGLKVVGGEVVHISVNESRWTVRMPGSSLSADAVMITGPGQPGRSVLPGDPRVWSIAEFWRRAAGGERIAAARVAVIGGGESTASILSEVFHHRCSAITVISPQVTLFTRGEGFFENSLFSDPMEWHGLTQAERRDAIARTDRGVFSARVQDALLADERIRHLRGPLLRRNDFGAGLANGESDDGGLDEFWLCCPNCRSSSATSARNASITDRSFAWWASIAVSSARSAVWTSALMVLNAWLVSSTEVPGCGEDTANRSRSRCVWAECIARRAFSTWA